MAPDVSDGPQPPPSPTGAASVSGAPTALGRYRVRERLGVGGMGAVYLACDDALARDVAIKVLRPLIAAGDPPAELYERFRREARAIALLTHPNVVRVYDQGLEGELPYLVMELVAGPTLAHRLKLEKQIPLREVRTLGIQLGSALGAAHAAGIVHRDVKPSNVLQSGPDTWKLADFGIAHMADSSLTITGQFLGTASFAAPEALEGRPVGAPADVYSLAATLYAALVGEPPYGDAHLAQLVMAMTQRPPVPLRERRPDLPASVASAIDRGLSRAPETRPTAPELARDLALDENSASARAATSSSGAPSQTEFVADGARAPARRRDLRRLLVGALVIGGVLAIGIWLGRSKGGGGGGGGSGGAGLGGLAGPAAATDRAGSTDSPGAATGQAAAATSPTGDLPQPEPGTPPPWTRSLPPELAEQHGGALRWKPSELDKQWRKAYDKLVKGDWDQGEEQLRRILASDPDNPTAREWLGWLQEAKRDPERFGVQVLGGEEE